MDGLILCDKPAGRSSHDVSSGVRRALGGLRTGHAGTLDPFATGLLVVLVGRATRVQRYLLDLPKTYVTVARLGATSSTGDPEGEIVATGRIPPDPPTLPVGELRQRPPAYSAVRIQGVRAYERVRRGEVVDMPERTVVVHRFEQLWREGDRAAFEIECSSGTYIRSLIADLGDAYCDELRRTAIGPFRVENAVAVRLSDGGPAPDDLPLIPLAQALAAFLPVVELADEDARRASHGVAVAGEAQGPVVLVDAQGPIAVAEPREGGLLRPTVGFRG
jgi:tRNA pseudouridine55 synthase